MDRELHLAGYREPLGLWVRPRPGGPARPDVRAHELEFASRGDRVTGQLILPAQGTGPFPVVIAQHALGGSAAELLGALGTRWVEAGFALAALDFPLHGARADQKLLRMLAGHGPSAPRLDALAGEFAQQALIDLERAVDALEAERAIDAKRIGYVGFGLGGQIGSAFCALDPRPVAAALAPRGGAALAAGPDPEPYLARIAPRPLLLIEEPPGRAAARIGDFLAQSLAR
jgi:dienelactone hydrolase